MLIEGYIPQQDFSEEINTDDLKTAIASFHVRTKGLATITSIDGREIQGHCEQCERRVFEDENWCTDSDELITICPECVEKEHAAKTTH